jgi:amidase
LNEILTWSALKQAAAIRRGEVSSEELTRMYLERIDRLNPSITAFVTVTPKRALRAAKKADKLRSARSTRTLPLFHGVPTGIKDLVPTRGIRTTLGSRSYRYFISPFDGEVAKRIYAGGFVSLGKLATSELGVLPVTEPDTHSPTRNPWSLGHTPGGSSGGSGAAVAAGLLPIAHGSDGGGSVRIPSAFSHLFGFKPSLSLLGNLHGQMNDLGLSVMGPLGRYVDDCAGMLDVMAGCTSPELYPDSCLAKANEPVKPLRVHMVTRSPVAVVDPENESVTRATGDLLRALGHEVIEVEPLAGSVEEFLPIWQRIMSGVPVIFERPLQPVTRWLREAGRSVSFEQALEARDQLCARIDTLFEGADLMLSPTVPGPPPEIGAFDQSNPAQAFADAAQVGAFTASFNLSRGAAASLPLAVSKSGLPIGVQLGARPGDDHRLLAVCRQVEEAQPWHHRWAPLATE